MMKVLENQLVQMKIQREKLSEDSEYFYNNNNLVYIGCKLFLLIK